MSNHRYLEIDSTYRDRTLWPLPGQFEIPISQSGTKDRLTAVDPISLGAPITAWSSNEFDANGGGATINGTINALTGVGSILTQSTFTLTAAAGFTYQELENYYLHAIIRTATPESRRIIAFQNLGNGSVQITVDSPFSTTLFPADVLTIYDPTDITDTSNPYFFVPDGQTGANSYIGCFLYNETLSEARPITGYDFITHLLSINTSVAKGGPVVAWLLTHNYLIRKDVPQEVTSSTVASTTLSIVLTTGSSVDGFYNGQFIRVRGTTYGNALVAPEGEARRIVSYDGATLTAIVSPPFSSVVGAVSIEILAFTRDNLNPFVYTGSMVSQQEMVCYEIELLNLILPNRTLSVGAGSRIAFYPYVYVELANVSSAGAGVKNIIYSNNPNSTRMLFRVPIDDVNQPVHSPFIKIDGDGMVQTIKFKPNDNLRFSVRLQNGEIYQTLDRENFSPLPPNELVQVSVCLSIKRL
jgi:hypothetical protein